MCIGVLFVSVIYTHIDSTPFLRFVFYFSVFLFFNLESCITDALTFNRFPTEWMFSLCGENSVMD
jgi:hypothetical protein